jgi:glycosyltransferase involved in cell wall biosynthesis
MKKNDYSSLLVVIPARDEAATVGVIVNGLREKIGCDVVVIDDVSADRTADAARKAGAVVLPLRLHLNAWGATQAGLRYAVKHGYDVVVTMDSDGQHLVESVLDLLVPIRNEQADVVIGAFPQRGSRARHVAWDFFRKITGLSFTDLTSGLRAYNRKAVELLASPHGTILDHQDLGVLLLLRSCGLTITEVPVVMQPRVAGKSKVFDTWFTVFLYMLQTTVLCMSKASLKNKCETDEENP